MIDLLIKTKSILKDRRIITKMKYDFYLASGWFSPDQEAGRQTILDIANELGLTYFSPKDEIVCAPGATIEQQEKVFSGNIDAIKNSRFVVVNTAGKDMGTIFEAGASYVLNKPIIYLCLGLKGNFNLMLSRSGAAVATTKDELREHLSRIQNEPYYRKEYIGNIE